MIIFYIYALLHISFALLSAVLEGTGRLISTIKFDYSIFLPFSTEKINKNSNNKGENS